MCYCKTNHHFQNCCEPFIEGFESPSSAEQLMRARYTAFYLERLDFLNKTSLQNNILSLEPVSWTNLNILNVTKGQHYHTEGFIEFDAYFHNNQQHYKLHEISHFIKKSSKWLYLSGTSRVLPIIE